MPGYSQNDTKVLKKFGAVIKAKRDVLGISQEELADRAGLCQCALQRDPPCARKSDPPLGVMCKDTKWGFNEGGKRGSATLRLSSPPRASTIRARPFVKDGCVSGGFRFLFQ